MTGQGVVLRAFLLGAAVTGAVAYALGAALVVAAAAAGSTLRLAVGPVVMAAVEREGAQVVTTLGPGLGAVAIAGGLLNAAAGLVLLRASRDHDRLT